MSNLPRIISIDGEELVAAIRREAADTEGWVHATGQVEEAQLKVAAQGADRRRTLSQRATLAVFSGPVGGPFGATVVRDTQSGPELYAGVLLSARALGVSVLIVPATVAEGVNVGRPAPAPGSQSDEEHEQLTPEVGDLIHHFAFGRSEVVMATGDRLKIRDVVDPGRVREISIERLKVTGPVDEGGKRLFTVVRKA